MKRPTMLYQAMLRQLSIDLEVSTERDYESIRSRLEHEGLSFLTITLPTLSDSLESGLESGRFTLPLGFKAHKRGGTLPALLQGLFKRVFHLDGSLLSEPCPESIYWIRQVSRFFKKPKIACSPEREAQAIRRFKAVEGDLNDQTPSIVREDNLLDTVARILWTAVFPTVDRDSIVCGHGPGVTADRRRSNERRRINRWYERFETSFPVADHAFHNYSEAWQGGSADGVSGIEFIGIADEPPVRVVFVPKTMTAPRVIAIEPSPMQFVQQGLSRWMVDKVEGHVLTRNSVRFSDQTVNRTLAYKASIDRSLATIDLSDASDRVHLELVKRVFGSTPLLDYLVDARSLHADLPDGSNLILNKYASMGSALCFPVEACVFYTLVLTSIIKQSGKRPNYRTIRELSKRISVFGDDIIVPSESVDAVSEYLESYALRVNRRKSFSKSAFRESCGADYFNGTSVLPIYARQMVPDSNSEWTPAHIMAWIATSDQFYLEGKWHLCQVIRGMVESVLNTRLPRSRALTRGLAFVSLLYDTRLRWSQKTYSFQQKRLIFAPQNIKDKIDGDSTACFNKVFERSSNTARLAARHATHTECRSYNRSVDERFFSMEELSGSRPCELDSGGTDQILRRLDRPSWKPSDMERTARAGWLQVQDDLRNTKRFVLDIDPSKIDFHSTTKRGVFALKRQWVTIIS